MIHGYALYDGGMTTRAVDVEGIRVGVDVMCTMNLLLGTISDVNGAIDTALASVSCMISV